MMQEEVESIRSHLEDMNVEKKTYDAALNRIISALSVTTIGTQFGVPKQQLTPEAMGVFALVGQMLTDDEDDPLTEEEIRQLLAAVGELEERITTGGLPDEVKRFLLDHLSIIRRGLFDYQIQGARAFQETSGEAILHWAKRPSATDNYRNNEEVVETLGLWGKITKYGKRALFMHALLAAFLADAKLTIDFAKEIKQLQAPVDSSPGKKSPADVQEAIEKASKPG